MLTQGLSPDPKCKLNISALPTLPHLLDYLICTRNSVFIVLFLGMMGGGIGGAWLIHIREREGGGTGSGYYLIVCLFVLLSFGL